jgi:SAM-dependent methyltransferase
MKEYTPSDCIPPASVRPVSQIKRWLIKPYSRLLGNYVYDIPMQGRVLDIGCGNGLLLGIARRQGCWAMGVEPNLKMAEHCRRQGFDVSAGMLEEARFPDASFDTVILSQVLEHVTSPRETLGEIHRITRAEGRVHIYIPNYDSYLRPIFGRYWHGWHLPFHLYHFNASTLTRLAETTGFRVMKITFTTPTHFLIVSIKSALWGCRLGARRPVDRGSFLDRTMSRITLSVILRSIDPIVGRRGDCLMVELAR